MRVRHVTLMEPVESRNVKHVMPAMDALVTRMRYMGVCVTHIHSDRVKVIVAMAALAVASTTAARADVRIACATAAAACAGWLACNWQPAPSAKGRSNEICLDGREVEKPSRAIGLKKTKDARRDEPAKERPPRENEPGAWKRNPPNVN